MSKRGKDTNIQNIRSTISDSPISASLIERIGVSASNQDDLLLLRGLEAGPGISIDVVDFDNNVFNTTEKKIVISLQGAVKPPVEPQPNIDTSVAPGTYLNPTLTVDEYGRIVNIQNGVSATHIGEINTGENIGVGNGIFARKNGVKLQFKTVVPGEGIDIQEFSDQLIISATGGNSSEAGYCFKNTGVTREFVDANCTVVIPDEHQIMVYGRYSVRGRLFNYGRLVIL